MNYSILLYETKEAFELRTDSTRNKDYLAGWPVYGKALMDAGVFVGGAGLQSPETATTVRMQDGKRQVQDGPYADSKEQLGGFYIINVPSLDAALDWAAKVPVLPGSVVEVRPNLSL